jgi:hypothetical protein
MPKKGHKYTEEELLRLKDCRGTPEHTVAVVARGKTWKVVAGIESTQDDNDGP